MKKVLTLLVTAAMTMIFGCNETNNEPTPEISVNELKQQYDNSVDFYLLDVRTKPELEERRLSFTDNLIPYDIVDENLDELPRDKSSLIYVFCRTGRRSTIATDYLRSIGFDNTYNVAGGITAWQKAGYEIATGPYNK